MLNIKKTKIFTAILSTTLLISGVYTTPVYAKGLSKAVKKEYVKILKKAWNYRASYDEEFSNKPEEEFYQHEAPFFKIADVNNDGKKDLLQTSGTDAHGSAWYDIYLDGAKGVVKLKIVDYKGKNMTGEAGNVIARINDGVSLYKNYIKLKYYTFISILSIYTENIYKVDNNGKMKLIYNNDYRYINGGTKEERKPFEKELRNNFIKMVNGKKKKISKKEYKKFASKFKLIKGGWHPLTLENIKKYVK